LSCHRLPIEIEIPPTPISASLESLHGASFQLLHASLLTIRHPAGCRMEKI
jgi:hypothetical protein